MQLYLIYRKTSCVHIATYVATNVCSLWIASYGNYMYVYHQHFTHHIHNMNIRISRYTQDYISMHAVNVNSYVDTCMMQYFKKLENEDNLHKLAAKSTLHI